MKEGIFEKDVRSHRPRELELLDDFSVSWSTWHPEGNVREWIILWVSERVTYRDATQLLATASRNIFNNCFLFLRRRAVTTGVRWTTGPTARPVPSACPLVPRSSCWWVLSRPSTLTAARLNIVLCRAATWPTQRRSSIGVGCRYPAARPGSSLRVLSVPRHFKVNYLD